jgi:hypothetical protein
MYTFVVIRGNVMSSSEIKLFIILRNILVEILKYLFSHLGQKDRKPYINKCPGSVMKRLRQARPVLQPYSSIN